MTRYAGKEAVVVGGATGTGLVIATRLVEGGAKVLLAVPAEADRAVAVAQLGSSASVVALDAGAPDTGGKLPAAVAHRLGAVDFLFVTTDIARLAPTEDVTEAHYDKEFAAHTKQTYFTVQALLPLMADDGAIVFSTSAPGDAAAAPRTQGAPGTGVAGMTQAALAAFAQVLSAELAERRIRVNTLTPRLCPRGSAEDVARAALSLAVDARFTSGLQLAVDGGPAPFVPSLN
ncbi:SDR family oxidoreductase [Streptomyces monticola]|uniref:SDR family oxidoreductase n=1 Tax=Streptomyces monticola TaxID=2666263 RepID=A0ABW2JAW4_9ACTN